MGGGGGGGGVKGWRRNRKQWEIFLYFSCIWYWLGWLTEWKQINDRSMDWLIVQLINVNDWLTDSPTVHCLTDWPTDCLLHLSARLPRVPCIVCGRSSSGTKHDQARTKHSTRDRSGKCWWMVEVQDHIARLPYFFLLIGFLCFLLQIPLASAFLL